MILGKLIVDIQFKVGNKKDLKVLFIYYHKKLRKKLGKKG